MRKRALVGRRIVDVRFQRFWNAHTAKLVTVVDEIVLDNGAILRPHAFEMEYDIAATLILATHREPVESPHD